MLLVNTGKAVAAVAWTPASLPNLVGWWKADAGAYSDAGTTLATNGQGVWQWNDQSGNGLHLRQGTGVDRPVFLTGTLNGLPVLDFNAANSSSLLSTQTPGSPPFNGATTSPSHLSGFIVFKCTATSNSRVLCIFNTFETAADGAALVFMNSLTNPYTYGNAFLSNCTITSGSWNEIGSIFDGSNNTMYLANVAQTPAASTSTFSTTSNVSIGCDAGGATNLTGQVAEALITTNVISSGDRSSLNTYFLAKWGV
jgi:hypothetical protein